MWHATNVLMINLFSFLFVCHFDLVWRYHLPEMWPVRSSLDDRNADEGKEANRKHNWCSNQRWEGFVMDHLYFLPTLHSLKFISKIWPTKQLTNDTFKMQTRRHYPKAISMKLNDHVPIHSLRTMLAQVRGDLSGHEPMSLSLAGLWFVSIYPWYQNCLFSYICFALKVSWRR